MELKQTYLVQRLRAPYKSEGVLANLGEAFAFGGGLKNGGLSSDAMKLLKGIFSFDYMGAAEYEFGALPEAFQGMAKNIKEYATWEHIINKTPLYITGNADLKDAINTRLNEIAKGKAGYIKCGCDLGEAVGLRKSWGDGCKTIGWLELDNEFAFFRDKQTLTDFAALFGIETK